MVALDPGPVDLELDVEMTNASRSLRTPFRRDMNGHSLDGSLALVHDIDDVDRGARRDRIQQRLDWTRRLLGARVDPVLAPSRPGVEQSLTAPRDFRS